jgi:hypothetical protein
MTTPLICELSCNDNSAMSLIDFRGVVMPRPLRKDGPSWSWPGLGWAAPPSHNISKLPSKRPCGRDVLSWASQLSFVGNYILTTTGTSVESHRETALPEETYHLRVFVLHRLVL